MNKNFSWKDILGKVKARWVRWPRVAKVAAKLLTSLVVLACVAHVLLAPRIPSWLASLKGYDVVYATTPPLPLGGFFEGVTMLYQVTGPDSPHRALEKLGAVLEKQGYEKENSRPLTVDDTRSRKASSQEFGFTPLPSSDTGYFGQFRLSGDTYQVYIYDSSGGSSLEIYKGISMD